MAITDNFVENFVRMHESAPVELKEDINSAIGRLRKKELVLDSTLLEGISGYVALPFIY